MGSNHCCKVGAGIAKYDLESERQDDLDDYLVSRWVGEGPYSAVGYRTLADWFNKRMLRSVYLDAGRSVSDPRIDADYEALTSDDEATVEDIKDDLRIDGIDPEELLEDFVSRATMRRHLTNCLGAEKERQPASGDWELDKIDHARTHFQQSVESAIRSLANKGKIPGGIDADLDTPIVLSCPECTAQANLETALSRGYVCREHLGETSDPLGKRTRVVSPAI